MNWACKSIRAQVRKSTKALMAYALVTYAVITCATAEGGLIQSSPPKSGLILSRASVWLPWSVWPQVVVAEEPEDETIEIIIEALKGADESMQAMAIALIREMPGAEATRALAKELPNLSVRGQVQLLSALGDRGDRTALAAVVTATEAKDESVRISALNALGELGDASSVALLAQKAAATTGAEQRSARESLYRLRSPKVDEAIVGNIQSAQPAVKVELVRSIGERNIAAGVKTLLETAQDSDSKVRVESLKVLKTIAEPKYLPALVDLLINVQSTTERREAEKTVVAVSGKIADLGRRAEAVLAALPSAKDTATRCSLLSVLGRIGAGGVLPVLRKALEDKDTEVQTVAIRALSDWPTAEPADDLLKVAQHSDNQLHQILALRGYVRLIGLESDRPANETMKMYKQAMDLAPNVSEKKRVLSGLANVGSLAALQMAADYLADKTLQQEAQVAVVKIAKVTAGSYRQQTKAELAKVIQISKVDALRQQAKELINQIERFGDYLTAWQVSGPYSKEGADGSSLFDVAFAPEKSSAADVTWRIMPAGTNKDKPWLMELDKALGGDNRVAYLRNKVWSPKDQKVRLELGSDNGIKVWLNGKIVHANNVTRPASPADDHRRRLDPVQPAEGRSDPVQGFALVGLVEVTLKKGWNGLFLKITQISGEWAVCARFRAPDGSKLEGLKIQLED